MKIRVEQSMLWAVVMIMVLVLVGCPGPECPPFLARNEGVTYQNAQSVIRRPSTGACGHEGSREEKRYRMLEYLTGIVLLPPEQLVNVVISMGLALGLGFVIAAVYRYTHRGMNYESGFLSTLVLLSPIVAVVMHFIQGDLVLSLGLVGSLAIVRFRTPVKDTRDMVFIFWAVAVGLGTGTLNWTVAVIATLLVTLVITAFYLFQYGRALHAEYILVVSGSSPRAAEAVDEVVHRREANVQLRNHEVQGGRWELTYELRFAREKEATVRKVVAELETVSEVEKVSLLTPQLALPM